MNRFAVAHIRLILSICVGIAIFFGAPQHWALAVRALVSWNGGVTLFLVLIYLWMRSLSAQQICSRFVEEDESAPVILAVVTAAALVSVVAIVALLSTAKEVSGVERTAHFALAGLTVINSWLLVPTIFALHYADMFYSAPEKDRPLNFPNCDKPIFWDFAYFSFTISAACQTADVTTQHTSIRKIVTVHTVISFFFNASILGFAINVTADCSPGNDASCERRSCLALLPQRELIHRLKDCSPECSRRATH